MKEKFGEDMPCNKTLLMKNISADMFRDMKT